MLLALSNLIFFIISLHSGPIVGLAVASGVVIHWWTKRNNKLIVAVAIIWIFLHIYELIMIGVSSYPVLFYLNLVLPVPLLYFGLKACILMQK